jgi:hypothetical protein
MIIFNVENNNVACVEMSGLDISFEHATTRAKLLELIPGFADLSAIRSISFEPSRGIYHMTDMEFSLSVFDTPEDNATLKYISDNIDSIVSAMKQDQAAEQAEQADAVANAEQPQVIPGSN